MPPFLPDRDIPDLSGNVILITGGQKAAVFLQIHQVSSLTRPTGTSGIGRETVLALSRHNPAHIYFTGRNGGAAALLITEAETQAHKGGGGSSSTATKLTFIPCDLASPRLEIRRALAEGFTSARLDLFIANAGIMATPPGLTEEGWEVQWATNYLGHAVMLQLLRPVMLRTAISRFVSVSSHGHNYAPDGGVLFDSLKRAEAIKGEFKRYGQSKLGNILLGKAMARHHPQITSVSVHPGVVSTGILAGTKPSAVKLMLQAVPFLLKSAAEGAYNTLWAATADLKHLENGAYYEPIGKMRGASKMVGDENLAERLWEWTAKELQDLEDL